MPITMKSGPWSHGQIQSWLDATVIPLRLATAGREGPIVTSLWFVHEAGSLWCATQGSSTVAQRVRRDARVGWEVSPDTPPYRGVRGRGRAQIVDDEMRAREVLAQVIARYGQQGTQLEAWLLSRASSEVALQIPVTDVTSWDYAPRM